MAALNESKVSPTTKGDFSPRPQAGASECAPVLAKRAPSPPPTGSTKQEQQRAMDTVLRNVAQTGGSADSRRLALAVMGLCDQADPHAAQMARQVMMMQAAGRGGW